MPDLPYDVILLIITALSALLEKDAQVHTHGDRHHQRAAAPTFNLSPYAGINRAWTFAIERLTFRSLRITPATLPLAATTLTGTRARLSAVRTLSFRLNHALHCSAKASTTPAGTRLNEESFSASVVAMFRYLQAWEASGMREGLRKVELRIELEVAAGDGEEEEDDSEGWHSDDSNEWDDNDGFADLVKKAAEKHRPSRDKALLRYVGGELPHVSCVRTLVCGEVGIWPGTLMRMAGAMEGLGACELELGDAVTRDGRLRPEYRRALGEGLGQMPGTCEVFEANFYNESDGMDEQPAVLDCSVDYLSIGLRDLSMRLRRLTLEDLRISPSLFWPQEDEPSRPAPYWPNLTYMKVAFAQIDASGKWYTTPHAEDLPDRRVFKFFGQPDDIRRTVLDHDRLNTLFLAMAKAVKNMPAIENLELRLVHYDSLLEFDYRKQSDDLVGTWHAIEEPRLSNEVLRGLGINRN